LSGERYRLSGLEPLVKYWNYVGIFPILWYLACVDRLLINFCKNTLKNNGVLAETAEQKAEMQNNQFTSVFTTENTTNMP
jgi:hypothetical protein